MIRDDALLADLARRLDVLESQEAIRTLRNTYHDYVNTNRWSMVREMFTDDVVVDYSYLGRAVGRQAAGEFFAGVPELRPADDDMPFIRQFIHAHTVQVDGDEATGTSHLFATPVYDGQSFVLTARFTDRYRREAGRWLFSAIRLDIWYSVPLAEGWAQPGRRHQMSV
ncbi:nuclear transport factor 2 family protein [Kineosporia sp. J2-2]|uniref:Nuclear transport factor 2 family protein n=1 Tax=Kineosporia corallincola TaxID=2835133 RepID=A0ABS5TMF9_9ACTN|nr:nuclear transport factor 2 family protein [Kineosporia corallincola]MBT0772295.1 nuclear transport factor 2 family protein [Kineosporia corallincola]